MTLPSLSIAIVGADYPNKRGPGRRFELTQCDVGEPLDLRPEPQNHADEHAIAVYSSRGVQIGYVASERAPWIGKLMSEREVRAVFQGHAKFGAWARVAFDGEEPSVAAVTAASKTVSPNNADYSGFWPDPVYDD